MLAEKLYQLHDEWLVDVFRRACVLLFPQEVVVLFGRWKNSGPLSAQTSFKFLFLVP